MKNRILIVDDSVVVRNQVSKILATDSALDVVGVAASGPIALAKIPQINPDIIVLDVNMPEMDGLVTLSRIRETYPSLPVIMFSNLTQRGAETTLDALLLGANDYVTKPANLKSTAEAADHIRTQLIPRIKALCGGLLERPVSPPKVALRSPITSPIPGKVDIVAIGVSTGGPNALTYLLPQIPADFPVPMLIVQHMPPIFTKHLADRLKLKSKIRVSEAANGDPLEPGKALIAPGDFHMVVSNDPASTKVLTHQGAPENSCRPAVDVLFRSVANTYGSRALGIILTGMGHDGLRGCEELAEAGGQILVQDEASSVVWGMPGYVAEAGLADQILPLNELGPAICRRLNVGREGAMAF